MSAIFRVQICRSDRQFLMAKGCPTADSCSAACVCNFYLPVNISDWENICRDTNKLVSHYQSDTRCNSAFHFCANAALLIPDADCLTIVRVLCNLIPTRSLQKNPYIQRLCWQESALLVAQLYFENSPTYNPRLRIFRLRRIQPPCHSMPGETAFGAQGPCPKSM